MRSGPFGLDHYYISLAIPQAAQGVSRNGVCRLPDRRGRPGAAAVGPPLRRAAQPRIVNLSSSLGSLTLQADPTWAYYNVKPVTYCTSKAMINAWTILLAYELRETPFKVNAVKPGQTATDFTGHTGHSPAHAAQVVVQYVLLPPDGPTGQFVSEDGPTPW